MPRFLSPLVLLAFAIGTASAAEPVRAGAFAVNVTPEQFPVSVNGGMADRLADLVDPSADRVGLTLEEERLPQRIRTARRTTGGRGDGA